MTVMRVVVMLTVVLPMLELDGARELVAGPWSWLSPLTSVSALPFR